MGCCGGRCGMNQGSTVAVSIAAAVAVLVGAGVGASERDEQGGAPTTSAVEAAGPLDRTMTRLDGGEQDLRSYRGQVVMIVNTASRCGLTPQYSKLQSLYEKKKDAGFVVLGFPANNFMGQEPGTDLEISEFCTANYGVTFPMFSKISVKGDDQDPLYAMLTSLPEPLGGEIRWNFDKFLLDRSGNVVARFSPRTAPDDAEVLKKIDELLAGTPNS